MTAFELINFCIGKSLNDMFAHTDHPVRKSKTSVKECKKSSHVNLQRDASLNSNIHIHLFSSYKPKKTFLKIREVISHKIWRSHTVVEDIDHP